MRILFIGGSRFVGLHAVQAALARGHQVTLFNRGSNRLVAPGAEQLTGDREGDLAALDGGRWDVVVDTPGYVPRIVRKSAEALRARSGRYLFVSMLSVYADFSRPGIDEQGELAQLADPALEEVTNETYGGLKVLCERAVQEVYGERALIVRPGYIVGPHDPTDRFTYYPVRMAEGGEMAVPGDPEDPLQVIDARDLAAFLLALAEGGASGAYNATGPGERLTWGGFVAACARVVGSGAARVTWTGDRPVEAKGAAARGEFPLWAPASMAGLHLVSIEKARAAGLTSRPLEETIRDTFRWRTAAGGELLAGPGREREGRLLAVLREREGAR